MGNYTRQNRDLRLIAVILRVKIKRMLVEKKHRQMLESSRNHNLRGARRCLSDTLHILLFLLLIKLHLTDAFMWLRL